MTGVFFFGMGYSSLATAKAIHELVSGDAWIAGTSRSEEGMERLADSAYRMHQFDGSRPGPTLGPDLRAASHVVVSIPPGDEGDPVGQWLGHTAFDPAGGPGEGGALGSSLLAPASPMRKPTRFSRRRPGTTCRPRRISTAASWNRRPRPANICVR